MKIESLYRCMQLCLFLGFVYSPSTFAKGLSIDEELKSCLAKTSTDDGARTCYEKAASAWDANLNKNYAALRRVLEPTEFSALRNAQRKWIEFQASDEAAWRELFGAHPGTLDLLVMAQQRTERIGRRAIQIRQMLAAAKS